MSPRTDIFLAILIVLLTIIIAYLVSIEKKVSGVYAILDPERVNTKIEVSSK